MKKTMNFKPAALSVLLGLTTMMVAGVANAGDAPKSFSEDAVTLAQAIEIAKTANSGMVVDAERDIEKGQAVYEIEMKNDKGQEIKTVVDASTGEVIMTKTRRDHEDDKDDIEEDAAWLKGVSDGTYLSAEEALVLAEGETGGRAYSVDQDKHFGEMTYEVKLISEDGKRVETRIDATAAK